MGFKDLFVGGNSGNVPIKVKCTGCERITVVKIPSDKDFAKWNEKASCGHCHATNCWQKV